MSAFYTLDAMLLGGIIIFALMALFVFRQRKARGSDNAQLEQITASLNALNQAQQQMHGRLTAVAEQQANSQSHLTNTLNRRLEEVQLKMGESLSGSAQRTAKSLGELQNRLQTIDKAQSNIEKLSDDVLSLQDLLSNKQARGSFGEIQLNEIVSKALPPDAYAFQHTLSNNKRVDCVIHLPKPPGPLCIDSKFPLEAYEQLRNAKGDNEQKAAQRAMRNSIRKHIDDIAQRYIIEGETADGAILFLPSEAVYAELHANFADIVREGFSKRVWIVSPTTCMATLNTVRAILKDVRMRAQAGAIREQLGALFKDVKRLSDRVENLDKHFTLAAKDIDGIKISANKAQKRAHSLDGFEFDELAAAEQSELGMIADKGLMQKNAKD